MQVSYYLHFFYSYSGMKIIIYLGILICLFFQTGCDKHPSVPRPMGYNRIDIPSYKYSEYKFKQFSITYSDLAKVQMQDSKRSDSEIWFDILYPSYKAVLHCTYLPLQKQNLSKILEDNHRLVYSHVSMADGIRQTQYLNTEKNISGTLYHIEGDVATPIQFYVTDSVSHFLRGSLYYESVVKINIDSVAPVTEMISKDIQHLIETLLWTTIK